VLFGNANAGVAEENRHLVDWDSGQQHLDGEGVAEHMAVATLWRPVRLAEIGDFEQPAIGALPVGNEGFWQSVTGPEEIIGFGLRPGGMERSMSATWGGSGTKTGVPVFA